MKIQLKNMLAITAIALTIVSCSKDNDADKVSGYGSLKVKFDNVYGDADFAFSTPYTNTNGEVVAVDKIKYIVSNIVLTKENGSTFTIPKSESYFVINEEGTTAVVLPNIPAANYTKITYGIGVDEEQFNLGATGQGDFLAAAQDEGMMWSWTAGYKFVAFEGTFTSTTVTTATQFKVHTGKTGIDYNYTTVTLSFPDKALVRESITPSVHVFADISQLIDGDNAINLSEQATIMGGSKLALVTANIANMFTVDHVHND